PASRKVVADVVQELERGASLSKALGARPRSFPPIYRASVEAGEAAGAMPLVLQRLADHMEWTRGIRQTMAQALVYPAVLGLAILVLIVTLVTFLVPRIVKMFPGGADELPTQTAHLLALSSFMTSNWPMLIAGALLSGAAFALWVRSDGGRVTFASFLLRIPRIGDVVRMFSIAKFAGTAGTLQNAGCQIGDVIRLGGTACGNARMAKSFEEAGDRIQRGSTISEALGADKRMDPLLLQMVSVGESAGDLGGCLDKLGAHYDRELPRMVKWMLSFLEPLLLVVGGVAVLYCLFAALLPLLDMYERL
ncbi:MAG: type II secretion system F family protein, partial [Planctomycetota bacterium]